MMANTLTINNARLVLSDRIVHGALHVAEGRIEDISQRPVASADVDFEGDLLTPGLIELHTDHLESHLRPRPKVSWPALSALLAFDAQVAGSGITTVYDCLRAGHDDDYAPDTGEIERVTDTIAAAGKNGLLRAEHHLHVRCEICAGDVLTELEKVIARWPVALISLMDHTPGARQFVNIDSWRTYYGGKSGRSAEELDRLIDRKHELFAANYKTNRAALVACARAHDVVVASHDDATADHVAESISDGVSISEFPTTLEAARQSHGAGITVMMGAPNVVRGGSHSGNVAAEALAREGYLDALSSDYVPASLLLAAFDLTRRIADYDLPRAMQLVTANPARAAGLTDRGEIAVGKRADLVRVHAFDAQPIVREVYRGGRRVV
jgi:alpha-D-ribose 1-methylphosphonate 5-triphosphate diphosphatase